MSQKPAKPLSTSFFESDTKPLLVLILVPLLVYFQALWYGFSPMDEHWLILYNEAYLKESGNLLRAFLEPSSDVYYRPLHMSSFIMDYRIGKLEPFSYHLTNLILHLANIILLYKLLKQYPIAKQVSFCLLLLFSIHPVILSSVVWVPGRNDTILSLFFIGALYAQNLYFSSGKLLHIGACLLAYIGALLSKESAIFFPVIYLANGYIIGKFKSTFLKFALPMGIISIVWFFIRASIVPEMPSQSSELAAHSINFFKVMLIYFGKSLVPIQQSIYPTISNSTVLPGLITVLVILLFVFFKKINNRSLACFGLLIFTGLLIVPVWFMSYSSSREQYENRTYIPMLGMILFVSQLKLPQILSLRKILVSVIGILYLTLTLTRMDEYSNAYNFLEKAIEQNPDNYFFHQKMADELLHKNDLEGAVKEYGEAIRIQPSRTLFYNNRASIYRRLGKYKEALRDHDSAVVRSNYDPVMRLNRIAILLDLEEFDAALSELKRLKQCCQEIIPKQVEEEIVMKWTMNGFNKIDELLKQQPHNAILYANRAKLNFDVGRINEALTDKQKALSLDPKNEQLIKYLEAIK